MIDNYRIDQFGVIHQIEFTHFKYDETYISYYQAKSDRTIKLGYQRLGWILGLLDHMPESVLEIGYGTGTFIEAAQIAGVRSCAGCDITAFPLPAGVKFLDWTEALEPDWDVVAMFDVLEHVSDLSFLSRLKTNYLALAVPYCRWRELGDDWFRSWRMRLPDEHLHHFDPNSLVDLLAFYGFKKVTLNTFEDGIRLREGETGPNILSGFFQRVPSDV